MSRFVVPPVVALVAVVTLLSLQVNAAHADATIQSATVENGYPKQLVFKLTATATTDITDVTLRYTVAGRGASGVGKPQDFVAGKNVDTSVVVDTNPNTNWIPVGNEFLWHFELTLADGTTVSSQEQDFLYLPAGKDWQTAKSDIMTVYYTGARQTQAAAALQAADETYQRMGKTLLKTELPRVPVKVLIMPDNNALAESAPSKGKTLDNSREVVTCGFRPGNANDIIFVAASCAGSDPIDTVRHEFTHILNAAAGESTLVRLPFWLDEGLAVYGQKSQAEYTGTFQSAVRAKQILPFSQMNDMVSDQNKIILEYGQSFTMVSYLIDKYGPDKLNNLLAQTKKGTRFDEALKNAYGFDMAGFEKEFTASVGASGSGTQPTAAPTQSRQQQPQPTANATTRSANVQSRGMDDSGGVSTTTIGIIAAAVLMVLLALMAFLVAMMLHNNNRRSGPGAAPPANGS